jgi:hypothetical protein
MQRSLLACGEKRTETKQLELYFFLQRRCGLLRRGVFNEPVQTQLSLNTMPPQEGIHTDETNDHSLLSKTSYPHVAQTYQKTIKLLRNCGIEGLIQLPKIALIGNQSSGKSSLIEAISRVKVPRAAAIYTRCPMEVILSRSDSESWKCTVSLRFEHIDVPGTGTVGTTTIFATTDNQAKVPLILRRA